MAPISDPVQIAGARRLPAWARIALPGLVLAVAVAVAVASTGDDRSQPLTNGSPRGKTYDGGIVIRPGQVADFPVVVENTGPAPVTLMKARLIPLPGSREPRLVHVGVLREHYDLLTAARGWPIAKDQALDSQSAPSWAMEPLHGYVVLPWSTRKRRRLGPLPDMIEYGVLGSRADTEYAVAGLRVTYRLNGKSYTQDLYAGGEDCILKGDIYKFSRQRVGDLYNRYCARADSRAGDELRRLAKG
jgi:hypothetical protein